MKYATPKIMNVKAQIVKKEQSKLKMPIDEEISKINLTWSIEMIKSIDQSEIEAIKQALSKSP